VNGALVGSWGSPGRAADIELADPHRILSESGWWSWQFSGRGGDTRGSTFSCDEKARPQPGNNGPELSGKALDEGRRGVGAAGSDAESFIGRLRDECLNQNWFTSLGDAREIIEAWRRDYNNHTRPHSSLGDRTPVEFVRSLTHSNLLPQLGGGT